MLTAQTMKICDTDSTNIEDINPLEVILANECQISRNVSLWFPNDYLQPPNIGFFVSKMKRVFQCVLIKLFLKM